MVCRHVQNVNLLTILTEGKVTLVPSYHGSRKPPELQRCGNVVRHSTPNSTDLREVHKVSPFIATFPYNQPHPQCQVSGCQVHEAKSSC